VTDLVSGSVSSLASSVDPWSPDAPEDLPCRVQDSDLWFGDAPGELGAARSSSAV
jgi:hypothetical protein